MKHAEYITARMKDPGFREAYEGFEGEYEAMKAVYLARQEQGLTQQQLSTRANIPQKTISAIETGNSNAKVETLAKLAKALGKSLRIEFV